MSDHEVGHFEGCDVIYQYIKYCSFQPETGHVLSSWTINTIKVNDIVRRRNKIIVYYIVTVA